MNKILVFALFSLCFILIFQGPAMAVGEKLDSIAIYMTNGDSAYGNFENETALAQYKKAFQLNPKNAEAAWKLSRAYVDIGEIKEDKKERNKYFQKGLDYANKAVEINPYGAKGYLWKSISLGRVALDAGKKEQVRLSKEIKTQIDKSIELDSTDDIAWHVLGRWHRKMATLGWVQRQFANAFLGGVPKDASVEQAAHCFKKAIELNPSHINHHLELALTYEKLKKKDLAKKEYQKVIELPIKDSDDKFHKQEAQKRLSKLD